MLLFWNGNPNKKDFWWGTWYLVEPEILLTLLWTPWPGRPLWTAAFRSWTLDPVPEPCFGRSGDVLQVPPHLPDQPSSWSPHHFQLAVLLFVDHCLQCSAIRSMPSGTFCEPVDSETQYPLWKISVAFQGGPPMWPMWPHQGSAAVNRHGRHAALWKETKSVSVLSGFIFAASTSCPRLSAVIPLVRSEDARSCLKQEGGGLFVCLFVYRWAQRGLASVNSPSSPKEQEVCAAVVSSLVLVLVLSQQLSVQTATNRTLGVKNKNTVYDHYDGVITGGDGVIGKAFLVALHLSGCLDNIYM